MTELIGLTLALLGGLFLGAVFFGGLWWTVGKAVNSKASAIWFLASLLLRMGLTVAGFCVAAGRGLEHLLSCFLGFLIARQAVIWFTRPANGTKIYESQEAPHAP